MQGTRWHAVFDQGLQEQYYNNFSTLYDLSYNHSCPKLIKGSSKKFNKLGSTKDRYDSTENYVRLLI